MIFYKRSDTTWVQDTVISYSGTPPANRHIDLDEDRAVLLKGNTIHVYENGGSSWSEESTISGVTSASDVALYGDRIVYSKSGTYLDVIVYRKYGSIWGIETTWTELIEMSSVDMYGDYIVVGLDDSNAGGNGHVRVYNYDGTDWGFQEQLTASDGASGDAFGTSLEILGDYIIVGSPDATVDGKAYAGKAYIFHFDGTVWQENEILTDPIGAANDEYGYSVSIDAINRVVGAAKADPNGVGNQGKVIFGPAND